MWLLSRALQPRPPSPSASFPRGAERSQGRLLPRGAARTGRVPIPSQLSWGIPPNRWQLRRCPGSRIELINSELPQWKFTGCFRCARASRAPAAAAAAAASLSAPPGAGAAAPGASPLSVSSRTAKPSPGAGSGGAPGSDNSLITQVTLWKSHFAPHLAQSAPNLGSGRRGKALAGF